MAKYLLWKLFHCEQAIKELKDEIEAERAGLGGFNEQQTQLDLELRETQKGQGKIEKTLVKLEKKHKEREHGLRQLAPLKMKVQEKIRFHAKKLGDTQANLQAAQDNKERKLELIRKLTAEKELVQRAFEHFEQGAAKKNTQGASLSETALAEFNKL